ncbi:d35c8d83-68bb-43fb-bbd6-43592f4e6bf9 [Thermothielavioides terrestris]|uniref:D35c8d83-68bb-43fb-bbd6-43592f4e6bf9 n=1 Tax=Thermothielavioides terrestris TaxID=2587410 RepID=A0A446BNV3_9PEZI|nr:d35c8d83-68bb-43fb-bbd6-43592f4e6bf9 [Thermothielavioides terrestris]
MGVISRGAQVALRIFQLIGSVIVLGILGHFLHELSKGGAARDGRAIYGVVVASISTLFVLVFMAPFMYSFHAFPGDFALFVMWLILFCLLITRTGVHTCGSPWFYNYWGYYWGGWWRGPFFPVFENSGCGSWRTALAFSFMVMFAFLVTTILGAYVVSRHWTKKRRDRQAGTAAATGHPQTSQIGGPAPVGGGMVGSGNGQGTAPATQASQPGTSA